MPRDFVSAPTHDGPFQEVDDKNARVYAIADLQGAARVLAASLVAAGLVRIQQTLNSNAKELSFTELLQITESAATRLPVEKLTFELGPEWKPPNTYLVLTGDLIHGGEHSNGIQDSRGVVALVLKLRELLGDKLFVLRGNHEYSLDAEGFLKDFNLMKTEFQAETKEALCRALERDTDFADFRDNLLIAVRINSILFSHTGFLGDHTASGPHNCAGRPTGRSSEVQLSSFSFDESKAKHEAALGQLPQASPLLWWEPTIDSGDFDRIPRGTLVERFWFYNQDFVGEGKQGLLAYFSAMNVTTIAFGHEINSFFRAPSYGFSSEPDTFKVSGREVMAGGQNYRLVKLDTGLFSAVHPTYAQPNSEIRPEHFMFRCTAWGSGRCTSQQTLRIPRDGGNPHWGYLAFTPLQEERELAPPLDTR